ncbi:MAG: DUF3795 domain-containing protein [Anaerolineales bacterium]|nr:DUF3795 domain-containing protein [Anaerolineales bacterium]
MKMPDEIPPILLAPCGMNCFVCYKHLKNTKPCLGCWGEEATKPEHCRKCKIKDCAIGQGFSFCLECPSFPCAIIKRLDKSYRQRYQANLIDNAFRVKTLGAEQFLVEERTKWTCADCGGVISLHDRVCSECGRDLKSA